MFLVSFQEDYFQDGKEQLTRGIFYTKLGVTRIENIKDQEVKLWDVYQKK